MSDYFERLERQLVDRAERGLPRGAKRRSTGWPQFPSVRWEWLWAVPAVLVVVAVGAVFIGLRSSPRSSSGRGRTVITTRLAVMGGPVGARPSQSGLNATKRVLSRRLDAAFPGVRHRVSVSGTTIVVTVSSAAPGTPGRIATLTEPGLLEMFDWEASVLTPSGKTAASQLPRQDAAALALSEGAVSAAPGSGGMSLYRAVSLAARVAAAAGVGNQYRNSEYFSFGAPGSAACSIAAMDAHRRPVPGQQCLLAGPAADRRTLLAELPPGVRAAQARVLVVEPGALVVQARAADQAAPLRFGDPAARFYVLQDRPRLVNADIVDAHQITDAAGAPAVAFQFTPHGNTGFHELTAQLAHRGLAVSGLGQTLNQHFAVVLDNRLIAVPSLDFLQYPDGAIGGHGAEIITGGFTAQSAQDLAAVLRDGPLPLQLRQLNLTVR